MKSQVSIRRTSTLLNPNADIEKKKDEAFSQQAFQKEKVKIVSKREKSLQQKWIETVTNLYACSILATLIK